MNPTEIGKSLVGTWEAQIHIVDPERKFPGLFTFSSDGIVHSNIPPRQFSGTSHGSWMSIEPAEAVYTLAALHGSAEGGLSASQKVIGNVHYDVISDCWNGSLKSIVVDPDGHLIVVRNGTVTATRLKVERLD